MGLKKKGLTGDGKPIEFYGTPGRIRTCDLRIRSPLLYPAELQAHNLKNNKARYHKPHRMSK
jgi:hypothetical protein